MDKNRLEGKKKPQKGFRDLWDHNKTSNIHAIRLPGGEKKEGEPENVVKEIMAENFPNLAKNINL